MINKQLPTGFNDIDSPEGKVPIKKKKNDLARSRGGRGLSEGLSSGRRPGEDTDLKRSYLLDTHTHTHRISPSCWFSSLPALQSVNQPTPASFPKHPSICPCSGPCEGMQYVSSGANAPPTHEIIAFHEPNGYRTAQLGGPLGPWM